MVRQVPPRPRRSPARAATGALVAALAMSLATLGMSAATPATPAGAATRAKSTCSSVPRKGVDASGRAPVVSYPGYSLSYCTDFTGTALPGGWGKFDGVPQGDPSGRFDPSHVVVGNGMLSLNVARDPAHGNVWATGGVCHCANALTYGAYFVRSRVTGGGVDETELLWPTAPVWPPEVDFNETSQTTTFTHWYDHFNPNNSQAARKRHINLLQWHTWGLVWTPLSLTFLVDGAVWGVVTAAYQIPHQAMTLDLQQQTWCGIAPECPTKPVSMQVDWVSEFALG